MTTEDRLAILIEELWHMAEGSFTVQQKQQVVNEVVSQVMAGE